MKMLDESGFFPIYGWKDAHLDEKNKLKNEIFFQKNEKNGIY